MKKRAKRSPKKKPARARRPKRTCIVLPPGAGRAYPMGRIHSVFKADGVETNGTYSASEWWMDAHTKGPGPHSHAEDHAWYVLEGTMSVLLADAWIEAPKGTFVHIPGGTLHDFENRTSARAGMLSFNNRGGFEDRMPGIAQWFVENPPGHAE